MTRTLYVYAIVEPGVRLPRVAGHRIERVELGGVAAAAERRTKAPPLSEKALRDQYRVVASVHQRVNAIVPVRFGALVERDELERIASLRGRMLVAALRNVKGKSQMTVRLLGSAPARPPAMPAASGTDYLLSRAESNRPAVPPLADAIRRSVAAIVSAESIDPGRESIEVTINHLVPNGRLARYRSRVEAVAFESSSPASVMISGPMPPFAFAPDLWDEA
jgi:hypothetical protein